MSKAESGLPRTRRLAPKINATEREALVAEAGNEGVGLSTWLRVRACGEGLPTLDDPLAALQDLDAAVRSAATQVRRLGNNINQINTLGTSCCLIELLECRSALRSAKSHSAELIDVIADVRGRIDSPRTEDLQLRISEAELMQLRSHAAVAGIDSAGFLRALVRSSASYKRLIGAVVSPQRVDEVIARSRDIECSGGPVNELAHRLNRIAMGSESLRGELESEMACGRSALINASAALEAFSLLVGELAREMVR